MKLLITGAAGQVGTALTQHFCKNNHQILAVSHKELNITDKANVQKTVYSFAPNIIINTAAYTAVDKAEREKNLAFTVNQDGSAYLAQAAQENGSILVHLSTDYVFSGEKHSPYTEEDETNPINVYGESKLAGEIAIRKYCDQHIILRTSRIFGETGDNFTKTILKQAKTKIELDLVNDQISGATPTEEIVLALTKIINTVIRKESLNLWGTYHLTGTPYTSWFSFAQKIIQAAFDQKLIEKIPIIRGIPSEQYPTPAHRPLNSSLDCSKIYSHFNIEQPDWEKTLSANLKKFI